MWIQQNIIFVDIFNGKLLKHFISILAFGQFCLIWYEIQQRSPCLYQSCTRVSLQEGRPEIPELKYDGMLPFALNFENGAFQLTLELSSSEWNYCSRKLHFWGGKVSRTSWIIERMVWLKAFKELTVATTGLPRMQPRRCREELVQGALRGLGFL